MLFVCEADFSKSYGRILMKFPEKLCYGPKAKQFGFYGYAAVNLWKHERPERRPNMRAVLSPYLQVSCKVVYIACNVVGSVLTEVVIADSTIDANSDNKDVTVFVYISVLPDDSPAFVRSHCSTVFIRRSS